MPTSADTIFTHFSNPDSIAIKIAEAMVGEKFLSTRDADPIFLDPIPIETIHQEWQLITLGISVVLIVLMQIGSRNFFGKMKQAFISLPIFKQMIRDEELLPQGTKFPLFIANTLVATTLFFNITEKTMPQLMVEGSKITIQVFTIAIILVVYFIFQYFLLGFTGLIFKTRLATSRHLSTIHYYQSVTTFILIPILIFYIYSPSLSLFYFSVITWFSIYLIRIVRGMIIVSDVQGYSRFQNILYICALEILPLLILVKLIVV